jgi:Caspase domain/Bacterial SH3 domain
VVRIIVVSTLTRLKVFGMKRLALLVIATMFGLQFLSISASAERRLAIVIGNNDYQDVPKLEKAVGDSTAIGLKLEKLGFTVTKALNVDRRKMNQALSRFYESIEPGDTVLVQYSGHGVELQGQNYLLPIDAPAPDNGGVELLKSETISLQVLIETLVDKKAGARILIIDACRDNPFAQAGKRSIGGTRGLAKVEVTRGTFIMYSAGTGQSALDRLDDGDASPTSVYTRVLLKKLDQPGTTLRDLASSVREDVFNLAKDVGHEQYPAYYDEMPSNFLLSPTLATATPTPTPVVTPPVVIEPAKVVEPQPPPSGLSEDQAFKLSQTIDTVDGWNVFLSQYSEGVYVPYARAAREKLAANKLAAEKLKKQQQQATLQPPKKIDPPKTKSIAPSDGCSRGGRVTGLPENDNFLAVRSGPGTGFQEVDRIFNGDTVSICSRQGKWLRVKYGGGSGWVSGKYVEG